jgi:hypothetical protein
MKWAKMLGALCLVALAFLFAIYIWPTRYMYTRGMYKPASASLKMDGLDSKVVPSRGATGVSIRIDRFTGRTDFLHKRKGWVRLDDK